MTSLHLCLLDTTGIQAWLFGSNKLKDNLGGSLLAGRALGEWLTEAGNPAFGAGWDLLAPDRFLAGEGAGCLVYSGGGNALLVARDSDCAATAVRSLQDRLMRDAPGLGIVAGITPWDGETASFPTALDAAWRALGAQKGERAGQRGWDLPAVLERCSVTAGPAAVLSVSDADRDNPRWVTRGIQARRDAVEDPLDDLATRLAGRGRNTLQLALGQMKDDGLDVVRDLDSIRGRTGEQSLLGVVHIDANGMGDAFRRLVERGPDNPGERLGRLRAASEGVEEAAGAAIARGIDWLRRGISKPEGDGKRWLAFDLIPLHWEGKEEIRRPALPMRPVVVAGDEFTFIAEGSLALDLAAEVAMEFAGRLRRVVGFQGAEVCAGVSFGRAHAPFSRLVGQAHDVVRGVKNVARERTGSWIDWRFLGEGTDAPAPSARPYALESSRGPSWRGLLQLVRELEAQREEHHTAWKALAEDLRSGPSAVRERRAVWKSQGVATQREALFEQDVTRGAVDGVWLSGHRAPLADAIQLMDLLVPRAHLRQGSGD